MTKTILVADDDRHIRDVIEFALNNAGMETVFASNGVEAIEAFHQNPPDLVVLDVGMPEADGLEVCRTIRKTSECPILFLSARSEEVDRIVGLELGADDYVTKPFSPRELVARVNAILKRAVRAGTPAEADDELHHGVVVLHRGTHRVKAGAMDVELTGIEFEILGLLMARPGIVFSRSALLDQAWPNNINVSDRTIDSHIRNLRAKLRRAGCHNAIRTVHGVGFQLDHCEGET